MLLKLLEVLRDIVGLVLAIGVCGLLGSAISLHVLSLRLKFPALALPVIGFGWLNVIALLAYKYGVPPVGTLFVSVFMSIVLVSRHHLEHGEIIEHVRRSINALSPLFFAALALIALIILLPDVIGGARFWIFQGNPIDQLNYLGITGSILHYDYRTLNRMITDTGTANDFARYASSFLKYRPSINATNAVVSYLYPSSSVFSAYNYIAFCEIMLFLSCMFFAINALILDIKRAILVSAACTLGFYAQYVADINAWSQLGSLPLLMLILTCTPSILRDGAESHAGLSGYQRILMTFLIFTPLFYVYPEMVPLILACILAAASPALLSLSISAERKGLAYLCAGLCGTLVICIPYWEGTILAMTRQGTFAAGVVVNWHRQFQNYIFFNSIVEPGYDGLYGFFSWPVDTLYGILGLYFLRPPAETPRTLMIIWKMALYLPLIILLVGVASVVLRSFRLRACINPGFFVRFLTFAALGGLLIFARGQYWIAGKWLAEFGVGLIPITCVRAPQRTLFWKVNAAVVYCYLGLNVAFGLDRVWTSIYDGGVAHASPAYPAVNGAGLKSAVDWDIEGVLKEVKNCRHTTVDIAHPYLDHYTQLALTVQDVPWTSRRPINDYYGMVPDRDVPRQPASDCLLTSALDQESGKTNLVLSAVKEAAASDSDDAPVDREIALTQLRNVRATGLYSVELFNGQLLRWTNGDATFDVADWGNGKPGSLTLKVWGIALGGRVPFTLTANGITIDEGAVTPAGVDAKVEVPAMSVGQALELKLTSAATSPPGESRKLGLALKSITLNRGE